MDHQHLGDATAHCCAECGKEGGATLKVCKSCMFAKYCNADCQRNHWKKHKKECKLRAAELHDEVLFKDPPAKEDCPICFLPMPLKLICCVSLPPATILSVPIDDYATANEEMAKWETKTYIHVVGRVFVEDAYTSSVCPETRTGVLFAMQIEWAKQMKIKLKK